MRIADLITLLRLILLPFYLWSLQGQRTLAVITIAGMILSDLADGRIARKLHQETDRGRVFDSIVDYLVVNICFIGMFVQEILPTYLFLYIMMGTVLIVLAHVVIWRVQGRFMILNSIVGKCRGTFEYVVIFLLTADWALGPISPMSPLVSTSLLILVPLIFLHSWNMVRMAIVVSRTRGAACI